MEVNHGSQSVDRQTDRQTLSVLFRFSHKLLTFDQLMNKLYAVLRMRFLCFENQLFMEVY